MKANRIERIALTIPGIPVAKPRMTQRDKWAASEPVQRYRGWADQVKWNARKHMRSQEPISSPMELCAVFYLPIPTNWPDMRKAEARRSEVLHTTKPDLKNLLAGLEDALNKIAWVDDSQICSYGRCVKVYDDGDGPRTVLLAYAIGRNPDANRARQQRAGQLLDGLTED